MPIFWLGLIFLSCVSHEAVSQETVPSVTEVSPEELAEFRLTWYTEKVHIPLEDLTTPAGVPFNPLVIAGKYVFLNFWATWCPYCAKEKPSIQQLYEENESDTFTVLTVSLGDTVNTETGRARQPSGELLHTTMTRRNYES
jgi:thiol-disulfide isomerase/thioredoxin